MAYQPKHQVIGSDGSSGYVIPNDMSDIHNIRLRNPRVDYSDSKFRKKIFLLVIVGQCFSRTINTIFPSYT